MSFGPPTKYEKNTITIFYYRAVDARIATKSIGLLLFKNTRFTKRWYCI